MLFNNVFKKWRKTYVKLFDQGRTLSSDQNDIDVDYFTFPQPLSDLA